MSEQDLDVGESAEGSEATPGGMLRAAREALGLSIEAVAAELYMTPYKVRALEANDFKKVNADAFIRGYLKTYSALVKIDRNAVLAAYESLARTKGVDLKYTPKKPPSNNKRILFLFGMLLIALVVLWLISVWFLDNRRSQEYKVAPPVIPAVSSSSQSSQVVLADPADAIAVDADDADLAVNTLAQGSASSSGLLPVLGVPTESAVASSVQSAVVSSAQSSSAQISNESNSSTAEGARPLVGGLDRLSLVFSDECWVEITDASGDVLASDLERSGAIREVQGTAPFQVKLGNAKAVRLSLNGYDVPIEPRPGTNVRTLKIGR